MEFEYSSNGKPSLKQSSFEFNWSHSGDLIALILGDEPCGIDIELHHNRSLIDFKSLYTPYEIGQITAWVSRDYCTETEAFFMMWSAKEAALKATGLGLSLDPRHFEIQFPLDHPNHWELILDGVEWKGSYQQLRHQNMSYALSWCMPDPTNNIPLMKEIILIN